MCHYDTALLAAVRVCRLHVSVDLIDKMSITYVWRTTDLTKIKERIAYLKK